VQVLFHHLFYLYWHWKFISQEGVGISSTYLTPPHFRVCYEPGPRFLTSYVVVLFVFGGIFRHVDMEDFADHHCLKQLSLHNIAYLTYMFTND